MVLQDEIFDVMAALEGKPEYECFESILAHLNKLEDTTRWTLSGRLVNVPDKAEELCVDKRGNLYWRNRFKTWTKGVNSGNYSAFTTDSVIATKDKML